MEGDGKQIYLPPPLCMEHQFTFFFRAQAKAAGGKASESKGNYNKSKKHAFVGITKTALCDTTHPHINASGSMQLTSACGDCRFHGLFVKDSIGVISPIQRLLCEAR